MADNGVIGVGGGLPWHLPEDLKHFKRLTMGHTVIMGRRTWDEVGRPLPGRRNIVVTRQPGFRASGAEVAGSVDEAIARAAGEGEVFVIGGGEVYRQALPVAGRLVLTHVHARVEGDTTFPQIAPEDWDVAAERSWPADARHAHRFTIRDYRRARQP